MLRQARVYLVTGTFLLALSAGAASAATIYLDGLLSTNCTNGNYSIVGRNCSGSDGNAYRTIPALPIAPGDTVLIRGCAGANCPDAQWKYVSELTPPAGPSASNRTTIKNYNDEQVLICASQRACDLGYPRDAQGNADMDSYGCGNRPAHWCDGGSNDGGFCTNNSGCPGGACSIQNPHDWYGGQAISLGDNTIFDGVKTWGAAFIGGSNSTVQNSDIGGCGIPSQGQVVRIENAGNVLLRNNFIHHSCKNIDGLPSCSTDDNGQAVFGYDWQATIENNEIWDYWYGAIRLKDGGDSGRPGTGGDMTIRYNYIRDTSIYPNGGLGDGPFCFQGYSQDEDIDNVWFYQNICYKSSILHFTKPRLEMIMYNNTFIDSLEANHQWLQNAEVNLYNSLSYIDTDGRNHMRINNNDLSAVNMDANLYWSKSAGFGRWYHNHSTAATSLSGWQAYTGNSKDGLSKEKDPLFANIGCIASDNCIPADFKRDSYTEDFASHNCGSRPFGGATGLCGARAGAYVTGNEIIGVDAATNPYWDLHHAPAIAACADGIDNDGDGNADLADSNCSNASDTSESQCGDGVREPGAESCDGSDVGSETCATQGFSSGTLTCNASCNGLDTSACTSVTPPAVNNLRIVN